MDTSISRFRDLVTALPATRMPVVTAFADLARGGTSGEPTASTVLEHALRNAAQGRGITTAQAVASFADDLAALRSAVDDAVAGGALGLAYVGCAGDGIRHVLRLPVRLRNAAALDDAPPTFELDRARYLYGQPVVLVLMDMHTVDLRRLAFGEAIASGHVSRDAHDLTRRAHGRTNVEGRTGTPVEGFAGGHSRNDVQRVVREHRLQFARTAGDEVGSFVEPGDLVVVAGPAPARAQLLLALPASIAAAAIETTREPAGLDELELVDFAQREGVEARWAAADARAGDVLSGALGDRALRGPAAVSEAIRRGQLGELLIHEDAAPCLGTADDTRARPGTLAAADLEPLLRGAHRLAASVIVTHSPALLSECDGIGGVLRW